MLVKMQIIVLTDHQRFMGEKGEGEREFGKALASVLFFNWKQNCVGFVKYFIHLLI